jgi:hypothetical protein
MEEPLFEKDGGSFRTSGDSNAQKTAPAGELEVKDYVIEDTNHS